MPRKSKRKSRSRQVQAWPPETNDAAMDGHSGLGTQWQDGNWIEYQPGQMTPSQSIHIEGSPRQTNTGMLGFVAETCSPSRAGEVGGVGMETTAVSSDEYKEPAQREISKLDRFMTSMEKCFNEGSVTSLLGSGEQTFGAWKRLPLTIAVAGVSGAGKSSLINAIRGLEPDDFGAAKDGITQTTLSPTPYSHPDYQLVQLWDLPALGTPELPRDPYMRKIEPLKYDVHFIVACNRFTEYDLWLARSIQERRPNAPVYFVRTKVDLDLYNIRRRKRNHSSTAIVDEIREDCLSYLRRNIIRNANVFVVSNVLSEQIGDLERLKERLDADAYDLKRGALLVTLTSVAKQRIKEKEDMLKERAKALAVSSGAAACIPIPGVSAAADIALFLGLAHSYRNDFGLDDRSLALLARLHSVVEESLTKSPQLDSLSLATTEGIKTFLGKYAFSKTTSTVLKYLLPGAGSLIAGSTSYVTTWKALQLMIETFARDAQKVYDFTHCT